MNCPATPSYLKLVTVAPESPWMTAREAAHLARCGLKTIYREVRRGRLKAARIGGRREIRIRHGWLDEWLEVVGVEAASGKTNEQTPTGDLSRRAA